jgi:nitrogen fixation NifU-like protein
MSSDFDQFAKELQKKIIEDMRRIYSEKVIDHFSNPRNVGEIERADGHGKVTGLCGDTMEIYLRIRDNRVMDAKFMTDGCGPSIVCGSMVTELAIGKSVKEALQITKEKVLESLGGLPESDTHCAVLTTDTLHKALMDYLALGKQSRKKRSVKLLYPKLRRTEWNL